MRAALASYLLPFIVSSAFAQEGARDVAERLLDNIRQFSHVPGHAAAVAVEDELVWTGETGFADVDGGQPVAVDSRFRLASVSKLYTATLLLKLSEAGRLDLDADVRRYVPSWPAKDGPLITARQLAAHVSGIPHYGSPGTSRPPADRRVASIAEALVFFRDAPLEHRPGAAYTYSSYGYALLAAVAAAVTQESFPLALSKELLEPAELRETDVEDVRTLSDEAVRLYDVDDEGATVEVPPHDQSYVWGATGMRASARDVARFGYRFLSGSIVSSSTVTDALQPYVLANRALAGESRFQVGFGWRVGLDWNGRPVAHHAGLTPGARSILLGYPEHGVAVALLSNASWTSRMETTAELLAAPFLDASEPARACLDGDYRFEGTFDDEPARGTLALRPDGALCVFTLSSDGQLSERWTDTVFPAVRVATHGREQHFAVAYPWGLAPVRVTPVGAILAITGDFAGRKLSLRGTIEESAAAARDRRQGASLPDRSPSEPRHAPAR